MPTLEMRADRGQTYEDGDGVKTTHKLHNESKVYEFDWTPVLDEAQEEVAEATTWTTDGNIAIDEHQDGYYTSIARISGSEGEVIVAVVTTLNRVHAQRLRIKRTDGDFTAPTWGGGS